MVLSVDELLHCEDGSRGLRRLETDGVYGVYEGGRLHLHFVVEQGRGCL